MAPLAERLRPKTLDEYIGQKHLVGQGAVLRKMIDGGRISSFILWGPPGVGKTTLAQIIANKLIPDGYTEFRLNCNKICENCNYCKEVQKKATITL